MMIMSSKSVCLGGHGLSCKHFSCYNFDFLPLKRKNIYHINTVLNQEFVNNIKQSPLSRVGVNYTTLFCGLCIMDFGNNSHVSSCLFQNESNQLGYVKLKEVSFEKMTHCKVMPRFMISPPN